MGIRRKMPTLEENTVVLTFDDGPDPIYTVKILDLLRLYKVRATFFMVGKFIEKNPDIVKRMEEEGHSIGLHSYSHKSAFLMGKKTFEEDMQKSIRALKNLGIEPKFYRPPWGHRKGYAVEIAEKYGLKMVLWDVMAQDWKANISVDEIKRRLLTRTKDSSVICLHDGRGKNDAPEKTFRALESVIPLWLKKGFILKTVEEAIPNGYR